jgi:hypothetical protein
LNAIIIHHLPYPYVKRASTRPYLVGGGPQNVKSIPNKIEVYDSDDERVMNAFTFQAAAWIGHGKRYYYFLEKLCRQKSSYEETATSKDAPVDPNDPTRGAVWATAINANQSLQPEEEDGDSEYKDFGPVERADEY